MATHALQGFRAICLIIVSSSILTSGCVVAKSQYESVVQEMENTKADLEKSRMVAKALEQELQKVKGEHEKTSLEFEIMASEVQRTKEGHEREQAFLTSREEELEQKREEFIDTISQMKRERQKLASQNLALKTTIERYQKELKDSTQRNVAAEATPPTVKKSLKSKAKSKPALSAKRARSSDVRPVTAPLKGALASVNINKASANDLVLFLGLTKRVADKVVANRPYRLRGELVAKNVIPKATFDVIKNRITAAR
ncbi:MAG: hypothetical protein GKS05_00935 [Nitrospirales bacterium]|nr:hypothetical protein [Nitrospirales bacterium]